MNRALAALLGLAVASPLIAVALNAAGVGPGFEAEAPSWSPGHNWDYDMTVTARAHGQIFGVAEGETPTVEAQLNRHFEVINTSVAQGDLALQAALQTVQLDKVLLGSRVVYDSADAETQASTHDDWGTGGHMVDDDMICLDRCETGVLLFTNELNPFLGHERPDGAEGPLTLQLFDFPLNRDKTWSVVSFEDDGVLFEITATATEQEYLDLPGLEPHEVIRIEAGLTDASRESLKRAIEAEAQSEEINLDIDFDLDFTYWYSPKAENVVRFVADAFVTGRGAGYGAAGTFRADMKLVEDLTGYELAVKDPRDLGEAERLANAARQSGTGSGLSATPFPFEIGTDDRHVDATAGETVPLRLVPVGQGGETDAAGITPPADARVVWTHTRTSEGRTITTPLEGPTAHIDVDTPGVHTMAVQVYDRHGLLMGADTLDIEGYTDIRVPLGPVGTPLDASPLVLFDVAPDALVLIAEVESEGKAVGTLTVEGPESRAQTGTIRSDAVHLQSPEPGAWTASWQETAHAGASELHLIVRYLAPEPDVVMADEGGLGWDLLEPLRGFL